MHDTVTNPTLFDTADPPEEKFGLWFRPDRPRARWELVFAAPTSSACVDQIGAGGRRHGNWLVLPIGQQP
jgi:hypothetical protein